MIIESLVISMLLTLALEVPFALLARKRSKDLLLVALVNILTNPVVVLTYWLVTLYTDIFIIPVLIILEVGAIVTEGYFYKKHGQNFRRPFGFSLCANMFSFGAGLLIQAII